MKKLIIVSLISLSMFMPQLYSRTIAELIQQEGMPQVMEYGHLYLAYKNITDLTGLQDISNKDQIRLLNLSNNSLQQLPIGIFDGFNNLNKLYLSNNQLQTLPDNVFSGLNNLNELCLGHNSLKTLPIDIFSCLTNLKLLYLGHNHLQELPSGVFNGLYSLRKLSLQRNQLRTLPSDIFIGLNNLIELNLWNKSFKGDFFISLPDIIRSIPSLQSLDDVSVDVALKCIYSVRNPKTLQDISANKVTKNFTSEQLERLAETNYVAFDLLPLSEGRRQAILNNIEKRKKIQFMTKVLAESLGQASSSTINK